MQGRRFFLVMLVMSLCILVGHAQMDETVTFTALDEGVALSGTITSPLDGNISAAVVLLPVAGPTDRDLTLGIHKYYKTLADSLAKKGIASLRFDDRGTGESQGEFLLTSLDDRTADACNALKVLQSNFSSVEKVGFIGMSEGAGISILADNLCGPVSFLVLLSTPARQGINIMKGQMFRLLDSGYFSDENKLKIREQANRFLDMLGAENPEENKEALIKLFEGPYGNVLLPPYGFVPRDPTGRTEFVLSPWYQSQIHYDITDKLKECQTRALAVYGSLDMAIDGQENANLLSQMAPQIDVKIEEGINHLMQEANTGSPNEYVFLPTSFSPIIITKIIDWINQL